MNSLGTPRPLKPKTSPLNIDNNFGMPCWEQTQLQLTLESPPLDQVPLYMGIWGGSSASKYFTQDAILAYGLSDILLADLSPLSAAGLEEDSSGASFSVSPERPLLDSSPLPTDTDVPERPARGHTARPDVALRTASKKPKRPSRRRKPVCPSTEAIAREGHNMVEKQYRSRLKAQFEALLSVLPVAKTTDPIDQTAGVNPGQCFSRGEVLDAARGTILRQGREIEMLAARRDQLERDLATMEQVLQKRQI